MFPWIYILIFPTLHIPDSLGLMRWKRISNTRCTCPRLSHPHGLTHQTAVFKSGYERGLLNSLSLINRKKPQCAHFMLNFSCYDFQKAGQLSVHAKFMAFKTQSFYTIQLCLLGKALDTEWWKVTMGYFINQGQDKKLCIFMFLIWCTEFVYNGSFFPTCACNTLT